MTSKIFSSHNSWTYLQPKKWWMRLLNFTAKCQNQDIINQYTHLVRGFDLRIRFDKMGNVLVTHGLIEYNYTLSELYHDFYYLNDKSNTFVRILLDTRSKKSYTPQQRIQFKQFCKELQDKFPNIIFWGGCNLYNGETEYTFPKYVFCIGLYASASESKTWALWPRLYAKLHNPKLLPQYLKDYFPYKYPFFEIDSSCTFMADFVNIR